MGRTGKLQALLLSTLALCLLTAGCTRKPDRNLPFYEFQDKAGVLVVEGVRYYEDKEMMGALGNVGKWIFDGERGNAIGLCGGAEEDGGEYTVYEVKGDEDRNLLYVIPNHFTVGPYRQFLGFREGIKLEFPTPETVSRVVVGCYDEKSKSVELGEFTGAEQIGALLELYTNQDTGAVPTEGTFKPRSLYLYHRNYPALYFYLSCAYHEDSGTAYLKCANGEYSSLPSDLEELIAVSMP